MTASKSSKKKAEEKAPASYRVLIGASFPGGQGKSRRIKPGQVVDDLPERVIKPLLEQGAIEEVK